MNFLEYLQGNNLLNEMPHKIEGDWSGHKTIKSYVGNLIGMTYILTKFKELKLFKNKKLSELNLDLRLFYNEDTNSVLLGYLVDADNSKVFLCIGYLKLKRYMHFMQTSEVYVLCDEDNDFRGRGIGYSMYYSLLKNGFVLISDFNQYSGAVALWKSFCADSKVTLDVYDDRIESIVKRKIKINEIEKYYSNNPSSKESDYLFVLRLNNQKETE